MPFLVHAQFDKPTYNYWEFYAFPKPKGNVKSVEIQVKDLPDNTSIINKHFKPLIAIEFGKHIISKVSLTYTPHGDLNILTNVDSFGNVVIQINYIYDEFNRIINTNVYKDKVKRTDHSYSYLYDSLGRWIETKYFDSIGKYVHSELRVYNKNVVTAYYPSGKDNKIKEVYKFKPNEIIRKTYDISERDILHKTTETFEGDNVCKIYENYYENNGGRRSKTIFKDNSKEGSEKQFHECFYCNDPTEQRKWKKNEQGDIIEELIIRDGDNHVTLFENGKFIITYKYEYDSHGNYTKKTEYIDGIPAYETIRTIEYYD